MFAHVQRPGGHVQAARIDRFQFHGFKPLDHWPDLVTTRLTRRSNLGERPVWSPDHTNRAPVFSMVTFKAKSLTRATASFVQNRLAAAVPAGVERLTELG